MAAGTVIIPMKDANGVTRNVQFWSSDGTTAGNLAALNLLQDGSGNPVFPDVTPVWLNALISKTLVNAGTPNLMGYDIYNPNASLAYVQVFNAATTGAVTLGTTAPTWVIPLLASSRSSQTGLNLLFSAGIVVAATTTPTGNTAVGTGLTMSISWR